MAQINLLPWRDEVKEQRKKNFIVVCIFSALLAGILLFLTWMYFDHQLSDQQRANQLVTDTNTELDKQLKSLEGLKDKRTAIIERMKLIQNLQQQRPITVHLIDDLVRVVPNNVYLTKFSRTGDSFAIEGRAESPNAVADMMRMMEASPWYRNVFMSSFLANTPSNNNTPSSVIPRIEEKYGTFIVTANLDAAAQQVEKTGAQSEKIGGHQ